MKNLHRYLYERQLGFGSRFAIESQAQLLIQTLDKRLITVYFEKQHKFPKKRPTFALTNIYRFGEEDWVLGQDFQYMCSAVFYTNPKLYDNEKAFGSLLTYTPPFCFDVWLGMYPCTSADLHRFAECSLVWEFEEGFRTVKVDLLQSVIGGLSEVYEQGR